MTGENGTPETPEWGLEQIVLQRVANDDGVRHDLRDVAADLSVDLDCPCESTCDVCGKAEPDGFGVCPLPERFELGEN